MEYRGYTIAHNFYGRGEYTVCVDGDDVWFWTLEEATSFVAGFAMEHDQEGASDGA